MNRAWLAIPLALLAVMSSSQEIEQVKEYTKPVLTTRVFPPLQTVNLSYGCSPVHLTAEIKGPEDERWYCPKVVWEKPDHTRSVVESDCPPFEERNQCYPKLPAKCAPGWHRKPDGEIVDNMDQDGCECNIIGYPRTWTLDLCYPAHPDGEGWEVFVHLEKNNSTFARRPVVFYIK